MRARTPYPDGERQQKESTALRDTRGDRLLDRILDTPHLARAVPRLRPELFHRVIRSCGLEDCAELVALATPDQLARVFDLDLWRTGRPGLDEQFDADRFGLWLEVLVESSASVAAGKIAEMNTDLVVAGLAQHVRVFDPASFMPSMTIDGEEMAAARPGDDGLRCEVGGYVVTARRIGSWDAILAVLIALDAEYPDYFHRVMRGCRALSNSRPEVDGLHDLLTYPEQVMFDVALDRERRREKQGFATPGQARAFLQTARLLRLEHETPPSSSPVARAYFRAVASATASDSEAGSTGALSKSGTAERDAPPASADPAAQSSLADLTAPPSVADPAAAVSALVEILIEAGVVRPQPRVLLQRSQGHTPRLARLEAQLQVAYDRDQAAYAMRNEELAYLANAIMSGCSMQARSFTPEEASDAAAAACNLGLENWPPHWLPAPAPGDFFVEADASVPDDFLVGHDLVSVFQVGWAVLHTNVGMYAAERLIEILTHLRCDDREIQAGLDDLRVNMTKHWQEGAPWRARDALDVIAILDMPAWATLLGLIDECPVVHAAIVASQGTRVRSVGASAFEFISANSQIASVRDFMQSLPETLSR